MGAEFPADVASGTVSKHKSKGVDDRHERKYHAGGTADTGSELADKEGVGHVVDAGHQHADGGGKSQPKHQPGNRRFCHFVILFLCTVSFHIVCNLPFAYRFLLIQFPVF